MATLVPVGNNLELKFAPIKKIDKAAETPKKGEKGVRAMTDYAVSATLELPVTEVMYSFNIQSDLQNDGNRCCYWQQ